MDNIRIETNSLILRSFEEKDMEAIYLLFSDKEVNTFLPWYPVKDMKEAKYFFEKNLKDKRYCFAICLKDGDYPVGYRQKQSQKRGCYETDRYEILLFL